MSFHPATLGELIAARAAEVPHRVAFIEDENVLTHAQFHVRCRALAAGLHLAGVRQGDRIALLAHNGLAFVEVLGAAAQIGAAVSCLNWRLTAPEVGQVLESDRPSIVFASAALVPLVVDTMVWSIPTARVVSLDERLDGHGHVSDFAADPDLAPNAKLTADTAAVFIHTAWTDGAPKSAVLTHGNLVAGAQQLCSVWKLGSGDVHWCALPLFHITALTLTLAVLHAGGCSVLQARFRADEALRAIELHRATLFGEFSPMLQTLLQEPGGPARLATVRHVCGLDAPETIREFESRCPASTFWSIYGQSEAGGLVTMAPFRDAAGSAGRAMPLLEVSVLDEDGQPLPPGQVGEIVVRGRSVFAGYWNRPENTALALRNGWLHTGDAGSLDEQGRLFFRGRLAAKELIKSGGENVYPAEVEKVLREHAAVADAAVIGVPDARWGESVRAVCVLRSAVTEQALIDFVGSRIASYKRPRAVVFADVLPLKADGTHDRNRIVALFGS
jgi:acyl-CoA synthetase (AMP-forming)/AMP-acid ligase II